MVSKGGMVKILKLVLSPKDKALIGMKGSQLGPTLSPRETVFAAT